MCTVTFLPGRKGYRLGMNRDEQLTRPAGLPPKRIITDGREFVAPSEPGGGMWIGLNDQGACLALINWYAVSRRATSNRVSRGEIIRATRHAGGAEAVERALAQMPLKRINPFRLVGVFLDHQSIFEWRWDLKRITRMPHLWRAQQWISSGFDEPGAQRVRSRIFNAASRQKTFGTLDWLRRLHRSHAPEEGPFSICMHRADAATVSYTEISATFTRAILRYHNGPPCERARSSICSLTLDLSSRRRP